MRLFSVGRVIVVAVLFAFIGFAVAQTVPAPLREASREVGALEVGATDRAGSAITRTTRR